MSHSYPTPAQSLGQILELGDAVWFPRLNCRLQYDSKTKLYKKVPATFDRSDSDGKTLIASLQVRGYDPQWPAIVGPLDLDGGKPGALLEEAVADRTKMWEFRQLAAKTNPGIEAQAELAAFEYYFTTKDKKGNRHIRKPKFLGCTCNRRSEAIYWAAVARLIETYNGREADEAKGLAQIVADQTILQHPETVLDSLHMVAIYEEALRDPEERKIRQMAENDTRQEGCKVLSPIEKVIRYKEGVQTGRLNQNYIRRAERDGEGQKIFGFITLDGRFPVLTLEDRLLLPTSNLRAIEWSKLPQGEFAQVVRDSNEYTNRLWNEKNKNSPEKQTPLLDAAGVDAWFDEKRFGKGNKTRLMSKPKVQNLQSANPNLFTRLICQDFLEDKQSNGIDLGTENAPAFNSLLSLVQTDAASGVNELLATISAASNQVHVVEELVRIAKEIATSAVPEAVPEAASEQIVQS